jgi:hypothetical protein
MPAIIGVINRPDAVGPWPLTFCRYSGRNVTAPNSAAPTRNPIAPLTLKTWLRNSLIGKIGSAALRSTSTNAASSTTPAALTVQVLADQAGLPWAGLVGLSVAGLVGWRLRFRPSEQVIAWQRGAAGERRTARVLERLTGDGYVVFHDLAVPGSSANVDHLVIGPSGVFVIDSKQWSGSVRQGSDGLAWHNHYRLNRTLETVRWEARVVGRLLGTRTVAVVCVHGAHVQGGGLEAQGVAIVPAHLLRAALGYDRVLLDADVALLATTARTSLRPAT